jgi:protoheme IX farnesyltransferase
MAETATAALTAEILLGEPRAGAGPVSPPTAGSRSLLRDYLTLTKPRIMSLLVLTSVCAMIAGAGGSPAIVPLAALLIGGALACGGASALNHVLDRDIDRLMGPRTASRPVAAGRVAAGHAVVFGLVLSALAFAVLAIFANLLAAGLALSGGAFYVLIYTVWLKRSTEQNIVIGGAAGAIPPLAGWAAAHGSLGWGALALFAIVLLWTPPHFWALALLLKSHYQAADVPMLPVVRGSSATVAAVLRYTGVLVVVSLIPTATGIFGFVYLICAVGLGAIFLGLAWRLRREYSSARAAALFHYSLLYLALLFGAVAVDAVIRW